MNRMDRSRIAFALVLILVGAWFLAVQYVPALQAFGINELTWPLIIVAIGIALAVIGIVTWVPEMLVPACIVGGIGGLLYWQNTTHNWQSWAYAWTLIPGFIGVGVFFSSGLRGKVREALTAGGWLIVISAILFLIFGSFLGGPNLLGVYWPILLIALGVVTLLQGLFRPR